MATKAKTAGSTSSAAPRSLEEIFSDGINLLNAGKHSEAIAVFQEVEAEASTQGRVAMVRAAKMRIAALSAQDEKPGSIQAAPELEALIHLNRGESDEALKLIEKLLKTQNEDGRVHYLKAIALAQKQDAEASASALKIALQLDSNLIHLFRNERDFDQIRAQAPFASFELA